MKIICSKDKLTDAINIVSKAVSNKTALDILTCILLIADNGGFRMIGNDLELGIETSPIDAEIIEPGGVALDARMFSEIIKRFPSDDISIISDSHNVTKITCGRSEFKILGQPSEEFPFLTRVEKVDEYKIMSSELREIIKQTIFSVAIDETKPSYMGELIEIDGNVVRLVSVDGFRISLSMSANNPDNPSISAIIPSKSLSEISKILGLEENQEIKIYFTDKHMLCELKNCVIVSRLQEGEFLRYENLFTEEYSTLTYVDREALISALDRAALISKDVRKNPIKLNIENDKMTITSNTDIGTSYDELNIETDGMSMEIAFNPRYLIEALKVMDDERVILQFTTPLSPCIIRGEQNLRYKYLILPLRVSS